MKKRAFVLQKFQNASSVALFAVFFEELKFAVGKDIVGKEQIRAYFIKTAFSVKDNPSATDAPRNAPKQESREAKRSKMPVKIILSRADGFLHFEHTSLPRLTLFEKLQDVFL
ncbi:MAG: hypothetical protein EAZ95_17290 [Bacteroidetes bacterium]|nr:MAG: hypothetical protein EAZ95_17290 [Bacteroidota bacterium]